MKADKPLSASKCQERLYRKSLVFDSFGANFEFPVENRFAGI